MPEYTVTVPLWDSHGLVPDDFPISAGLRQRLADWQARWDELQVSSLASSRARMLEESERLLAHRDDGHLLVAEVQRELGPGYEVVLRS